MQASGLWITTCSHIRDAFPGIILTEGALRGLTLNLKGQINVRGPIRRSPYRQLVNNALIDGFRDANAAVAPFVQ